MPRWMPFGRDEFMNPAASPAELPLQGGRMLVTLAHPDDESFGLGGTLALYARRGVQIHLVVGTRGEAGTVTPEFLKPGTPVTQVRIAGPEFAVPRGARRRGREERVVHQVLDSVTEPGKFADLVAGYIELTPPEANEMAPE